MKALILGFVVAVPVGPASLLCMQRTLSLGRIAGIATGSGVAMADAFYAIVVAGSLNLAVDYRSESSHWLVWVAAIVLFGLGLSIIRRPMAADKGRPSEETIFLCFLTAFLLTLTNPVAIILLVAGFALFGLATVENDLLRVVLLVAGIFSGSMLWWIVLVSGVRIAKRQLPPSAAKWINKAAGMSFVVFGLFALWKIFN